MIFSIESFGRWNKYRIFSTGRLRGMWALGSDFVGLNPRCSIRQIHLLNLFSHVKNYVGIYLLGLFLGEIESILHSVKIQQILYLW